MVVGFSPAAMVRVSAGSAPFDDSWFQQLQRRRWPLYSCVVVDSVGERPKASTEWRVFVSAPLRPAATWCRYSDWGWSPPRLRPAEHVVMRAAPGGRCVNQLLASLGDVRRACVQLWIVVVWICACTPLWGKAFGVMAARIRPLGRDGFEPSASYHHKQFCNRCLTLALSAEIAGSWCDRSPSLAALCGCLYTCRGRHVAVSLAARCREHAEIQHHHPQRRGQGLGQGLGNVVGPVGGDGRNHSAHSAIACLCAHRLDLGPSAHIADNVVRHSAIVTTVNQCLFLCCEFGQSG